MSLQMFCNSLFYMALRVGLEPTTCGLTVQYYQTNSLNIIMLISYEAVKMSLF